ncbi:MAG TPA: alpha-hydroxy acid oxidase [Terriglobia bacterium]|nr:alpha-hydroxy acid oxidase [Terriglobia bacterium]
MQGSRALRRVVNIEDLRRLARKRVPLPIFDYVDGGADGEVTLGDNRRSWDEVLFRPQNAVNVQQPDLQTSVLGCDLAMPMLLGPIGFTRLINSEGERAVAAAAGDAGIGFCMSSFSGYSCQSVAAAAKTSLWYQLYLAGGREVVEGTLDRAWKAGFRILAVTIDTNVPGNRERDLHNGSPFLMSGNVLRMLPYLPSILRKPGWLAQFMTDREAMFFPNIQLPGKGACPASDVRAMLTGAVVTWGDMKWIRDVWPGLIVTKGVITAEDARRAIGSGASGVIVSNHGGRQLDTCYPTLRALPEVVQAVNGEVPVLVDGGIRRGGDILKALCMGAQAVLIGRAYAYGLAAEGRAGVERAIAILKADLERTMALLGCASLRELRASLVAVPKRWTE